MFFLFLSDSDWGYFVDIEATPCFYRIPRRCAQKPIQSSYENIHLKLTWCWFPRFQWKYQVLLRERNQSFLPRSIDIIFTFLDDQSALYESLRHNDITGWSISHRNHFVHLWTIPKTTRLFLTFNFMHIHSIFRKIRFFNVDSVCWVTIILQWFSSNYVA